MVKFEVYVDDVKVMEVPAGTGDPFVLARQYVNENYPDRSALNGFEIKKVVVPDEPN